MKSWTSPRWLKAETPMQLQFVKDQYLFLEDSQENKDFVLLKSITSERTSGHKWLLWKTRDTIWVPALSVTNSFILSEASLDQQNKKLMIALRCMKSRRTNGKYWPQEWRTHFGHAVLLPFQILKSFSSVERIQTETEKSICLMWTQRTGNLSTIWIN